MTGASNGAGTGATAGGNIGKGPASIRYNNPGAQYPGPIAKRFGSTRTETIGGGHKIAVFDSPVDGAAAQFALLSRSYAGMKIRDAIRKWSGNNSAAQYVAGVTKAAGVSPDAVLSRDFLKSPQGIAFVKAMARHEAGRDYPMTLAQWQEAQQKAFGQSPAVSNDGLQKIKAQTAADALDQLGL